MSARVLLRLKDDDATYVVDLGAGVVSKVDVAAELVPNEATQFTGLSFAIVTEQREATATFPSFSD